VGKKFHFVIPGGGSRVKYPHRESCPYRHTKGGVKVPLGRGSFLLASYAKTREFPGYFGRKGLLQNTEGGGQFESEQRGGGENFGVFRCRHTRHRSQGLFPALGGEQTRD